MKTVKFDSALNEAGWVMINELQKHGEVNGSMFNAMKTCLSSAIGTYLLAKEVEAQTETQEEKERERLEAAYDLYDAAILEVEGESYTFDYFRDGIEIDKESMVEFMKFIVDKTNYRKGE